MRELNKYNWQISDRGHRTGCIDGYFRLCSYYDSDSVIIKSIHKIPEKMTDNIFIDKKGRPLGSNDVISNGHIIYRVIEDSPEGLELLSCTHGYKHNADQGFLNDYNRIGRFEDLKDLFECD